MGYRLIALDIDGTIRTNEYAISERTREAVANVRAAGADVTVATGRMFRSAVRASAELELTAPIASFQGAHVADPTTGEVLWHRPLTAAQAVVCAGFWIKSSSSNGLQQASGSRADACLTKHREL